MTREAAIDAIPNSNCEPDERSSKAITDATRSGFARLHSKTTRAIRVEPNESVDKLASRTSSRLIATCHSKAALD